MEQYLYDVFISYRRKGGSEKAQLVKSEIRQRGIEEDRIFLDTHSLHDGDFEQKIKVAIEQSKSVVVIISNGCFDEIKETDYWYLEIKEALQLGKNVVPVFFDGITSFVNQNVPQELQKLTKKNAVTYHHEYANAAFDKLLTFIGTNNVNTPLKTKKKGCLFSFKYKGCLLSITLIALFVFVFIPLTFLQFEESRPSPTLSPRPSPHNDDRCCSTNEEDAGEVGSFSSKETVPILKDTSKPPCATPKNDMSKKKLLGTWQGTLENKNRIILRLNPDYVIMEEVNDSIVINRDHGIYHVKGNKLFFEWSESKNQIARYKFVDEKLILSFEDGQTMILTR